ncbi:hypothetical protein ACFX10_009896 [Malus domestica]
MILSSQFPSQPPLMLIRDTRICSVMAWSLGVRSLTHLQEDIQQLRRWSSGTESLGFGKKWSGDDTEEDSVWHWSHSSTGACYFGLLTKEASCSVLKGDATGIFSRTSNERSLLWIAGYKPGIVFRLVTESVPDLSDQQQVRMARLREETRVKERALNDKLAKIHKSVAASPFMDAVGGTGGPGTGRSWRMTR